MKLAGYIRVSTGDQGLSLEAQETSIRDYCKLHKAELVDIFIDEDVSGVTYVCSRDNGKKLCDLMKQKKVEGVVCVKLDRMFRNAADALQTCTNWDKIGVSLHLIDMGGQSVNTKTAMGKMMLTMMAGFAEFERNLTSERTKMVLNHKRDNMQCYSNHIPYGFTNMNGTLIADESKLEVVNIIYSLRRENSYEFIARKLNSDSIPSPSGKLWTKATIFHIFKNPIYKNYVSDI